MVWCLVQKVCGQKENIPNKILRTSVLWHLLKLKPSTCIGGVRCWRSPGRGITHSHNWCSYMFWGISSVRICRLYLYLTGWGSPASPEVAQWAPFWVSTCCHLWPASVTASLPWCAGRSPRACQGTCTEGRSGCGVAPVPGMDGWRASSHHCASRCKDVSSSNTGSWNQETKDAGVHEPWEYLAHPAISRLNICNFCHKKFTSCRSQ